MYVLFFFFFTKKRCHLEFQTVQLQCQGWQKMVAMTVLAETPQICPLSPSLYSQRDMEAFGDERAERRLFLLLLFPTGVVDIDQESNPWHSVHRPNAFTTQTRKRWKKRGRKERMIGFSETRYEQKQEKTEKLGLAE